MIARIAKSLADMTCKERHIVVSDYAVVTRSHDIATNIYDVQQRYLDVFADGGGRGSSQCSSGNKSSVNRHERVSKHGPSVDLI
ncbi:MAG: hypothetical protein WB810_02920 [Candidatus Cybelea sp.]